MKALGIGVIVYGHVAHASTVALTPPIYVKQLGVALFLFAAAFTLARERRAAVEVVFNRLFQVYLFGLTLAALITVKGLLAGSGPALSNYLPFAAGANVLFDNFPANPTTWYIGTYLHLLIVWAVWLRRVRVRGWMVFAMIAIEIPIRAVLMRTAGGFVAYMLLTNWSAVFLLGMARGAQAAEARGGVAPYLAALAGVLAVGVAVGRWSGFVPTFPFMTLGRAPSFAGAVGVSAGVSFLYVVIAGLVFEVTRRVAAPAPVAFVARNSLIVFLAHMPVFLALHPVLVAWGLGYWARVGVQLFVCLPGLAIVSEVVRAVVRPEKLRALAFEALMPRRGAWGRPAVGVASLGER